MPLLTGSWAGTILHRMQEHYDRLREAARQRAEFESSAAAAARRDEELKAKQKKHAERLARKAERDLLWRQRQHNPGAE